MAPLLPPTNMTADEMIPDTTHSSHDPQFWCLPPVWDQPSEGATQGKFPMYLVTQGRKVGVWHNWTVVKPMVSGYPSGAYRGHKTMNSCVLEWQEHCALGVHPHPVDPGLLVGRAATVPPAQAGLLHAARQRDDDSSVSGVSVASTSSITATTWEEDAAGPMRYFAIWGGRIVFTDRAEAKAAFLEAEAEGAKPRILSTADYDEAQAFSESVFWCD
ncbi:hypothetical protein B0H13DRAFT_2371030 [Mycena leptocephala]|nr:hypothetical protein B0H13DRAFT_2371030 [Mycena leptocephala]